jgi:uncharacterized membrane protein YvbJ
LTDKEKMIIKFQKAIVAEDRKTLMGLLHSTDSRLVIDEKAADSLIAFVKKNPSYLTQMMSSINNQSKQLDQLKHTVTSKKDEKTAFADNSMSVSSSTPISFNKNGKSMLFYDRYVFEVKPYFINVRSSLEKTKVFIDEIEMGQIDKPENVKEFGPFIFGSHKVKGIYQGDYATIENEQELDLFNSEKSNVDIIFKANYINPRSNFDDAILFVNQKNLGAIKDIEKVGPVPMDGSVKMYAEKEFPWGKIKSNEVDAKDSNSVDLTISGVTDEIKSAIMTAINEFNQSDVEALTRLDASKFVNATKEVFTDLTRQIDNMKLQNRLYKGRYLKAIFDLDSFKAYADKNDYFVQVDVSEGYESTYYSSTDKDVPLKNQEVSWRYSLIYKEGKWIISNNERISSLNSNNQKTFDFSSKPVASTKKVEDGSVETNKKIHEVLGNYEKNIINAINNNKFSSVDPYLKKDSQLYKSQSSLVEDLSKRGIKEELVSYEIKEIKSTVNEKQYKVSVNEKINIKYPNETKLKEFNWIYTVDINGNEIGLSEIVEGK